MMRAFGVILVLAAIVPLGAPGCTHDEEDDDSGSSSGGGGGGGNTSDGSDGVGAAYGSGHPVTWLTTDSSVLAVENEVHSLVNDHRVSIGRNALTPVALMSQTARGHCVHMSDSSHSFFAHTNPEGDDPTGRYLLAGGSGGCGENIAAGYTSAQAAFNGWMGSPGHKANIENGTYTKTGIGYTPLAVTEPNPSPPPTDLTYTKIYTQMFQ